MTDDDLRDRVNLLAERLDGATIQARRLHNDPERIIASDLVSIIDDLVLALAEAVNIKHEAPQ